MGWIMEMRLVEKGVGSKEREKEEEVAGTKGYLNFSLIKEKLKLKLKEGGATAAA
jgi:hypothetical protein